MEFIKNALFALVLTCTVLSDSTSANAHDIKFGDLIIHQPWAQESLMMADAASGYMIITNTGAVEDRLVKAAAVISKVTQIHTMRMDGDMIIMEELSQGIVIPAGASIDLKPMSAELMFMGLKGPVTEGEIFEGTLVFEKADSITVDFEVRGPTAGMNMD